jgi:hypothetical protein
MQDRAEAVELPILVADYFYAVYIRFGKRVIVFTCYIVPKIMPCA